VYRDKENGVVQSFDGKVTVDDIAPLFASKMLGAKSPIFCIKIRKDTPSQISLGCYQKVPVGTKNTLDRRMNMDFLSR
jgi:hypothetical protein